MPETPHLLDARGLNCPLPVIKTRKALNGIPAGEHLRILSSDPGSVADMASFCRQTGNELVATETGSDGSHAFLIRKA